MFEREFTGQITFLHANNLTATRQFYEGELGLRLARNQGTCLIFQVTPTSFLGFCQHIKAIQPGRKVILTLVSNDVDGWYKHLKGKGVELLGPPKASPQYGIYHFFLTDPDGYWIEIQKFDDPL